MKIAAKIDFYNYELLRHRTELGWSQIRLSEEAQVPIVFIQDIEKLRMPSGDLWNIREKLNRIAFALDVEFNSIFPPEYLDAIKHAKLPKRTKAILWVKEIPLAQLVAGEMQLLSDPSAEDVALDNQSLQELKSVLLDVMATLTPREQLVIRLRYGLEDGCPKTLEEIARSIEGGVTSGYIQQVEKNALKRLRHPRRSGLIRDFFR